MNTKIIRAKDKLRNQFIDFQPKIKVIKKNSEYGFDVTIKSRADLEILPSEVLGVKIFNKKIRV